jgi:hypothetical protein
MFSIFAGHADSIFDRDPWRKHSGGQHLHAILQRCRTVDRTDHNNHVRSEQSTGHGRAADNGYTTENA